MSAGDFIKKSKIMDGPEPHHLIVLFIPFSQISLRLLCRPPVPSPRVQ